MVTQTVSSPIALTISSCSSIALLLSLDIVHHLSYQNEIREACAVAKTKLCFYRCITRGLSRVHSAWVSCYDVVAEACCIHPSVVIEPVTKRESYCTLYAHHIILP